MAVTTVWDTLDKDAQQFLGGNYKNIAALFQAMPEPTDSNAKVAGNKLKSALIAEQIGDFRLPNIAFMQDLNQGLASDATRREIIELSEKNGKALNGVMDRVIASPTNTKGIIDPVYQQAFPATSATNTPSHAPAAPPAHPSTQPKDNASPAQTASSNPPPSGDTQPPSNGATDASGVTPVDLAATSLAPGGAAAGLASAIAAIIAMIKFLPAILSALTKDGGLANLAGNSDFKGLMGAFSSLMGAVAPELAPLAATPDAAPTKPSVPMDQAEAKDPNAASAPNRRSLNALSQPPVAPTAAPATQSSGTQNAAQNNTTAKPTLNTAGLSAPS